MSGRLWGGGFTEPADAGLDRFTRSFAFDRRLARWDLVASLAHARMLGECGVLTPSSHSAIVRGLQEMLEELDGGRLTPTGDYEDVHTWIEAVLIRRIGPDGERLHTARSRNDQTSVALRLWVRAELDLVAADLLALQRHLLEASQAHRTTWMPGYTHLQRAQPVSLAHHLLAHFWALQADADRLRRCHRLAGCSPLGAGALAGTPHPIDPHRTAELLGFERVFDNSLHAVADRDYLAETLFFCALVAVHLSRWAEEVILWTSAEFGFASLADRAAKGSSLMPQKKNPEAAELIRGKSGRVIGDLTGVLTVLKGVPLAYHSDLQEDKEALFDALDTVRASLQAARGLSASLTWRPDIMREALQTGHLTATLLCDYLVTRGVPFRTAHRGTGELVRLADHLGCPLWELPPEQARAICAQVDEEVLAGLDPQQAPGRHRAHGGTAPEAVAAQQERGSRECAQLAGWLSARRPPPVWPQPYAPGLSVPGAGQPEPAVKGAAREPAGTGTPIAGGTAG